MPMSCLFIYVIVTELFLILEGRDQQSPRPHQNKQVVRGERGRGRPRGRPPYRP